MKSCLKMQKSFAILMMLMVTVLPIIESHTFNIYYGWFSKVPSNYKGPECIIEVIGADLDETANKCYDKFSKPDVMVKCIHDKWDRTTHCEGNTYNPRFVWQAKMPWKKSKGFEFVVSDANVLARNNIIGRAFVSAEKAKELINREDSAILNLGDGVGYLKINMRKAPDSLKNKIQEVKDLVQVEVNVVQKAPDTHKNKV
mmetsp:Transcript_37446/g.48195  ORF Transcript_37446/g.48195 Transcript_37446/m.48195 type:complete len:200 (-) Transcript_37446:154-753(-)